MLFRSGTVKSLALDDVYGRIAKVLLGLAREEDGVKVVDEKLTRKTSPTGSARRAKWSAASSPN